MIIVASSLSLLAIVAGMFLYAKTLKYNLNLFFKIVSYFIIIVGFLNLFVGSALMMVEKMYMHHQHMEMESYGHHSGKTKKHLFKHMSSERMNYRNCECRTESNCCDKMGMMGEKECEMGMMNGKECCPAMMDKESCMKENMMMKKDSMVMKKHHMK